MEVLNHALRNKEQRNNHGERQQQPQRDTGQIRPRIAECLHRAAAQSADQGKRHSDTGGGGQEVLYGQPGHLAEIADSGFSAVRLPVGIGDKTDRCVQCQIP